MKTCLFIVLMLQVLLSSSFAQLSSAQKLIVIVTDDWNSSNGTLFLFDKMKGGWKKQRQEIPVSVGAFGLGWGAGLHSDQKGEYIKREGDKRSPAGIFELDTVVYGIPTDAPDGIRYPYRPLSEATRCVDDSLSAFYNRIIEEDSAKKDWTSAESMKRIAPDYKYLIAIKHNPLNEKAQGSCIFFHINKMPTSGCTSMNEEDMLVMLHWLDPKRTIYVIQLPHEEYHRLRSEWKLPSLQKN